MGVEQVFKFYAVAAAAMATFPIGCGGNVRVFAKPAGEVHTILAAIDELPPVFGGDDPEVAVDAADPSRVVWVLSKQNAELMRFTAALQPVQPDRTRVTLALTGPNSGAFGNVQQRLEDHNEVRDFYVAAMNEQIASEIEARPFDITRTYGAMARATAAEAGSIADGMEAAAAAHKRDDPNGREAAAEAAAGV
jgi:hypothetical protein